MVNHQTKLRPNCDDLLKDKMNWALSNDNNVSIMTEIVRNYGEYIEKNFYRIFLREKLRHENNKLNGLS
jgi:hypothetical protein